MYIYIHICIYIYIYIYIYMYIHILLKMTQKLAFRFTNFRASMLKFSHRFGKVWFRDCFGSGSRNLFPFPWHMHGFGGGPDFFERIRFNDFYGFRLQHFWDCKFSGSFLKILIRWEVQIHRVLGLKVHGIRVLRFIHVTMLTVWGLYALVPEGS